MGSGSGRSSDSEEHYSSAEEDTACADNPEEAILDDQQHDQVLPSGNRCQRLERVLEQCPCGKEEPDPQPEEEPTDLASALASLEAERKSRREVMQLNVVLREHLEISTRTNEELTQEVRELTEEWQQASSQQHTQQQQQHPLESRLFLVSQWQQDLEQLRRDLGHLRQTVLADLSSLGGALAKLRQDCRHELGSPPLSAERWELRQEIAGDLNQQVDSLNAENDGLQQALEKASRMTKELSHKLDDRVEEVERLEGRLSELQAELSRAQQQGREKEASLRAELEKQHADSKRELKSLRDALRRTQELHEQLQKEHTGTKQEFSERLEQQVRECTERLESLLRQSESRQGELRQQLAQRNHELLDAQTALEQARARGDALSRELEEVREQLVSACRERESRAEALAQAEAQHTAAREDWQRQLHAQRATLEEEVRRAQGRAEEQGEACRRARAEVGTLQERLSEEQSGRQEALARHDQEVGRAKAEHDRETQRLRAEHEAAVSKVLAEQGQLRHELSEQLRQRTEECARLEERLQSARDTFHQEADQLEALRHKAQVAREEERQLLGRGLAGCREQLRTLRRQQDALQADALRMLDQEQEDSIALRDVLRQLSKQEQSWEERQRRTDQHAARLQLQLEEAARRSSRLKSELKVAAQRLADVRQSRDEALAEREQLHQLVGELRISHNKAVAEKESALQDSADRFREVEAVRAQLASECARLHAEHQEELQGQRSQADATLQRETTFWKAKVSLCESELRAGRVEREQLSGQLREAREQLAEEQRSQQAQALRLAQQRAQEQADLQRRLLHEGQGLHRTRLALSSAEGRVTALQAHLDALAETRQKSEAVLCSLLSALRCALGVAPPQDGSGGGGGGGAEEEQQLVLAAVQGLVSRVSSLAKDKEQLEAEAEKWGREQHRLRAQLASSTGDLERLTAARERLGSENEELRSQVSAQLEEASRLRLQLQEVGWERASLKDQLEESRRLLELQQGQLDRLRAVPSSSEAVLDRRLSEQQLAEVQLAEARLDQLKRRLDQQAAEKSRGGGGGAGGGGGSPGVGTARKVQRLQQQLEAEQLRSERLAERERTLESQLREALARVDALGSERKRVVGELQALQKEKNTLETKFSAVAVQLAESEAAKQRLHQRRNGAGRDESLLRDNRRLEEEIGRLRRQLSRTVDVMFGQPRTSTPKPGREAPEGESLVGPPRPLEHHMEARVHTTLQVDLSRKSHREGDHSFQQLSQGRGDDLSEVLERSLHAVAERPDRLPAESRRLDRALEETGLPPSPS